MRHLMIVLGLAVAGAMAWWSLQDTPDPLSTTAPHEPPSAPTDSEAIARAITEDIWTELIDWAAEANRVALARRPLPGLEKTPMPPRVAPDPNGDLRVDAVFPGEISLNLKDKFEWGDFDRIEMKIYLPKDAGSRVSATFAIDSRVDGRFRTSPARMLEPGRWNTVRCVIDHHSGQWVSEEHFRVWDGYAPQFLHEVSLRLFCDKNSERATTGPFSTSLRLRPLRGRVTREAPLEIVEFSENTATPGYCEKHELTFDLTRAIDNPFDPAHIDFQLHVTAPSGRVTSTTAFLYQEFERWRRADNTEAVAPVGKRVWKTRFAPRELGEHSWRLTTRVGGAPIDLTREGTFECVPSESRGFIRWDKNDPRYFAWDNGDFFYPIGHTLRNPWDRRTAYDYEFSIQEGLGTYAFEEYYDKMVECGENFFRMWMAAWWTALEWSHGYRRDYPGAGRYNLRNAWKQDFVLEAAQDRDIAFKICLQNHGQFRRRNIDHEWRDNPFNAERGGWLENPDDYFTDVKARRMFKQRMRYIVARWGYMSHLQVWELWNEVDLTTGFDENRIARWHDEMARYIKSIDPNDHIISTHMTRPMAEPIWRVEGIEFSNHNGYKHNMIAATDQVYDWHQRFDKPQMMNEYGVGNNARQLELNLHAGMWATYVTPFCQIGIFWWWHFLHKRDLYFHYRSLVDFHGSEDFRGQNLEKKRFAVRAKGDFLRAMGMSNPTRAYVWIFDKRLYEDHNIWLGRLPNQGARIELGVFESGVYEYLFWDTWKGEPLENGVLSARGEEMLSMTIPDFTVDCALRIKKIGELDEEVEPEAPDEAEVSEPAPEADSDSEAGA